MRNLTVNEFKNEPIDSLIEAIGGNKAQIIETSLAGLIEIGTYVAKAIANGPRIKRIQALEQYVELDKQISTKIVQEIDSLKKDNETIKKKLEQLNSNSNSIF